MATSQQILDALRKADAAGNTDDAKKLADLYRRTQPQDNSLNSLTPDFSFGEIASNSLGRGYERFKSTYGDVLPAMVGSALGFDEYAERQMKEAAESQAKIQRTMPAQFESFKDVNWANPIDISKFIVETAGEQAVNLAGILVPGGIGTKIGEKLATREAVKRLLPKTVTDKAERKIMKGIINAGDEAIKGRAIGQVGGVFLGSYGLNAPEVFQNIYDQTGSFEPAAAALAGIVNASLDSILPATLLNQFSKPGRATIISKILERSGMNPNLARKAVVQIAGSGVLEGLTEATQEAVSITAENFVQDHSYLFDSDDFDRMLEGGVRGTVAGGTFRGVGVAANKLKDKFTKTEAEKQKKSDKEFMSEQEAFDKVTGGGTPTTTGGVTGEQLELDLEGGAAQGQLDFDTGPTVGEQLELEGLGPKPTVGPLAELPDIYEARGLPTRQSELDFDSTTEQFTDPSFPKVPIGPQGRLDFEEGSTGQRKPTQGDLFFKDIPTTPASTTAPKVKPKTIPKSKAKPLKVTPKGKLNPITENIINKVLNKFGIDINTTNATNIDRNLQTRIINDVNETARQAMLDYDQTEGKRSRKDFIAEIEDSIDIMELETSMLGTETANTIKDLAPTTQEVQDDTQKTGEGTVSRPEDIGGGSTTPVDGGPKDAEGTSTPVGDAVVNPESTSRGATSTTGGVDPALVGKEVEVDRQGVKQKGTYIEFQGSPFIKYPSQGGTVQSAIQPTDKVKTVKEKPLKSIQKGNPVDKVIIDKVKSKKTLGQVLNVLKNSKINAAQKELVTLLLTLPNMGKTKFKVVEGLELRDGAYGLYNRQQDSIELSNNADVETILHEAVHAATANLLNKHIKNGVGITPLGKRVVQLYEDAIAADVNGSFGTALSKVDEFIAESFTNPEFQKFLGRTASTESASKNREESNYINELRKNKATEQEIAGLVEEYRATNAAAQSDSLWTKFVNAVKEILGLNALDYTILNDVIALAPELFVGPNAKEQAQATQEILFKETNAKTDALEGEQVPDYTKDVKTPPLIQRVAAGIKALPIADNRMGRGLATALSNAPQFILDMFAKTISIPNQIEMFKQYLPSLAKILEYVQKKADVIKRGREEVSEIVRYGMLLKKKYETSPEGRKVFKEWNEVLLKLSGLDINPETILADPNGLANLTKENLKAAALVRRYQKLPQDLKNLATRIVKDLDSRYDVLLESVIAAHKDLDPVFVKDLQEKYAKRPFYLPFVRKGKYWFTYTDKEGNEATGSSTSQVDREAEMKRLKEEEGALNFEALDFAGTVKLTNEAPPVAFVEEIQNLIKNDPNLSKDQILSLQAGIQAQYVDLFPEKSLIGNKQHRKGVPGYIEDIIFAYADTAPKVITSIANAQYNYQIVNTVNQVGVEAKGQSPMIQAIARNNIERTPFLLNPVAANYARLAAYGSYVWFLGFNVSSAIVNLTQLPLVVQPFLAGEYGGTANAAKALADAGKLYWQGGFEKTGQFGDDRSAAPFRLNIETGERIYIGQNAAKFVAKGAKIEIEVNGKPKVIEAKEEGEYYRLFTEAEMASALRRGLGYEITEVSKDLGANVVSGNDLSSKVGKSVGYIFQNSERINREITLVAAFNLEMEQGSGNKDIAIQKAIELTSKIHSHALPEVGPSLFQDGIGKVAFVFKRFAQAQIYLIMRLFYQAYPRKTPANLSKEDQIEFRKQRSAAKKQLLGVFAYSFLIAGAQGVPLYGAYALLTEIMLDDEDDPFDADMAANRVLGDVIYRGPLSYILGADISKRTGFRHLLHREDPVRLEEVGLPTYAMETVLGPAFSGIRRINSGFEFWGRGQEMRAIERFMPTAISNGIKTFRQSMEGVTNKNGVPIIEGDPSAYESLMQIVGFTNIEVSEAYDRAQAVKGPEGIYKKRRSSLLLRYWLAKQEGDTDGIAEVNEDISEFNSKAPRKLRITNGTKRRSTKGRQQRTKDSVDGVFLPKSYRSEFQDRYIDDEDDLFD